MSEFEDRENELNGMGELPDSIQQERKEFSQFDAYGIPIDPPPARAIGTPRAAGIPPDIAKQNEVYADGDGRLGSPVIPATVTSIYDARPVNARDFKVTSIKMLSTAGGGVPQTLTADYTVPLGYTTVLKGFQFVPHVMLEPRLDEATSFIYDMVDVTLLINDIVQQDYNNLKFGPFMDLAQETFLIASELQIITLKCVFSSDYLNVLGDYPFGIEDSPVLLQLYGNNLLTRGLPTPFEIATQIKSGINVEEKT